jgi:hypothetical protein
MRNHNEKRTGRRGEDSLWGGMIDTAVESRNLYSTLSDTCAWIWDWIVRLGLSGVLVRSAYQPVPFLGAARICNYDRLNGVFLVGTFPPLCFSLL